MLLWTIINQNIIIMKKKNLKSLKLNRNMISNLKNEETKGGKRNDIQTVYNSCLEYYTCPGCEVS